MSDASPNDDNDRMAEQLNCIPALPAEEIKSLWIKYYAARWKRDPAVLAEAYDRAYLAGWFAGVKMGVRKQVPTPGLGISYPDDYRYPKDTAGADDPDYFNPAWKSC
jgi:hypothetical protein